MRLLCVSTAKNTDAILEKVVELSKGKIELVFHVGSVKSDLKGSSLARMVSKKTWNRSTHPLRNSSFYGGAQKIFDSSDYEENLALFVDHLNRRSVNGDVRSHKLTTVYDYYDYYHILCDFVMEILTEKKVTHLLFFNVPHLTYDTIFYQMAKSLGLPTLMVTQSLFPNKYYSLIDINSYGDFQLNDKSLAKHEIKKEVKDLFYMKGITQGERSSGRLTLKSFTTILAYLFYTKPLKLLNILYVFKLCKKADNLSKRLPKWRDPFGRFFSGSSFSYFEHLLEYEEKKVDLNQRFVYFPLHLQPEMTTSSLGGIYKDQALAIEKLSMMLPEGVKIYVKENPKQGAFMRGPMFFYRLKRLKNVEFLPSYTSTHELLARSEFVATITGTVGWEALQKGKNVLVFGNAWYMNFPGAVKYTDLLQYQDVLSISYTHEQVESAIGQLLERCHDGVVDRHYQQLVPDFNQTENDIAVAETLIDLLKETKPTVF